MNFTNSRDFPILKSDQLPDYLGSLNFKFIGNRHVSDIQILKYGIQEFAYQTLIKPSTPNQSFHDYLMEKSKGQELYVDCCLFVQACIYLKDSINGPWLFKMGHCPYANSIAPQPTFYKRIMGYELPCKSQWVLFHKKNSYLGITKYGIHLMSDIKWAMYLKQCMLEFIRKHDPTPIFNNVDNFIKILNNNSIFSILSEGFNNGCLNTWVNVKHSLIGIDYEKPIILGHIDEVHTNKRHIDEGHINKRYIDGGHIRRRPIKPFKLLEPDWITVLSIEPSWIEPSRIAVLSIEPNTITKSTGIDVEKSVGKSVNKINRKMYKHNKHKKCNKYNKHNKHNKYNKHIDYSKFPRSDRPHYH